MADTIKRWSLDKKGPGMFHNTAHGAYVKFTDHETALSELRAEVERYKAALMKIMWHRTPSGSPSKYQYEIECMAAKVLGSEAFTATAARSASPVGAAQGSAEGGV